MAQKTRRYDRQRHGSLTNATAPIRLFFEELEPRIAFDAAFAASLDDGLSHDQSDIGASTTEEQAEQTGEKSDGLLKALAGLDARQSRNDQILFIDPRVPNLDQLLTGIDPAYDVILLDADSDGVEQIADILSTRRNIEAIHIISHGDAAHLQLGNAALTSQSMAGHHADELATIGNALTDTADILIYGCNFGEGEAGLAATNQLALLTGADVAASNDLTGQKSQGGDWDLEVQTGAIEAGLAISSDVQTRYQGTMAVTTVELAATDDTFIDKHRSGDNFGTSNILGIDKSGGDIGDARALLKFDLSGIPAGATITKAGLVLEVANASGGFTVDAYQITSDWSEGGQNDTPGQPNWDYAQSGVLWTSAGGDYTGSALASVDVSSAGQHTWEITSLVQAWHAGTQANHGVMLGSSDTGGDSMIVYSAEGATPPKLIIQYDLPAQPPVITSNGGGALGNINVMENQSAVTTVTASDANGDTVTFSISGGTDAARFSINSTTGVLNFVAPPDFENPTDANTNNGYEVVVTASDNNGGTDSQTLLVTVTDDAGEGAANLQTLPAAQTLDQDSSHIFSQANGNAITVSDGTGSDAALRVTISSTNGTLTLAGTAGLTVVSGSNGSSQMIIEGLESSLNAALNGLSFAPTAGYSGSADISVKTARAAQLDGHYSFDNSNANDEGTGTAQNGTLQGDASIVNDPTRGNVLDMDGDRDYVTINSDFGEPSNVTLSAWVKFSTTGTKGAQIIDIDYRVMLWIDDTTNVLSGSIWDGSSYINLKSTTNIGDNTWHHVAFVFDDTNNVKKLYLDGVEVESEATSDSIVYDPGKTSTVIGAEVDLTDTGYDFDGRIDDARIYSRALSANEIAALAADNVEESGTIALTINALNTDPELTITGGGAAFQEGTSSFIIDGMASISDADGGDFENGQLIVTIATNGDAGDRLLVNNQGTGAGQVGVSGNNITYNSGSGAVVVAAFSGGTSGSSPLVITFNAQADANIVTRVARQVSMGTVGDDPSGATRTISFRVTDGDGGTSPTRLRTMTIVPVNDTPTVNSPGSALSATEQVGRAIHGTGFSVSDPDAQSGQMTATISVTQGRLDFVAGDSGVSITSGSGTASVTFTGTLSQINNLLTGASTGTITYLNMLDAPASSVTISLLVNDGGNTGQDPALTGDASSEEASASQTINITRVNDDPTGVPTITGTAEEDQTLTADVSAIADLDGLGAFSYQWRRDGADISGATSSTYQLTQSDVGTKISVRVSYTDAQGTAEGPLYSTETVDVVNVNDAPAGQPTISGTLQEGQTLTADATGVTDEDGISGFAYQWLRDGVAISGATGATHQLTAADIGKRMSVQVTFTDGQGTSEGPVVSAQTGLVANVNDAPVGLPAITGTAEQGQTLTADTSGIADADGLGAFSYQWQRDGVDITGATGNSYQLQQADVGTRITVEVRYADGQGTAEGPLTSAQTVSVANINDTPAGQPTISGTLQEGQTLTADATGVTDEDGISGFAYQWLRDGVAISGATGATHQLTAADIGKRMSVQVTFTDDHGTAEGPITSVQTGLVANTNDAPVGVPVITGTAEQGQTLTADTSGISDGDGLGAFSYQWQRDGTDITGATGSSYQLLQADVDTRITVEVRYTDGQGTAEGPLTSAQTASITNINDAPTGLPVVAGAAQQGQTLTADTSGIADADGLGAFSYQWKRDGTDITGATGNSYQLQQVDVETRITVEVRYTDGQGTAEGPLTSTQTASVINTNDAPVGLPTIAGTTEQGQILTADTSGISDADGLGAFSYQWHRDGVDITGATGNSYQLQQADVGTRITVEVRYTDGQGTAEGPIVSAQTVSVANINDAPTGLPLIAGTVQQGQVLSADTSTISDADGLGAISYQWQRDGVDVVGATGASYQLVVLDVGHQISVQISYIDGQGSAEQLTSALTKAVAERVLDDNKDPLPTDPVTDPSDPDPIPQEPDEPDDTGPASDTAKSPGVAKTEAPPIGEDSFDQSDKQVDPLLQATDDEAGEQKETTPLFKFQRMGLQKQARLEAIRMSLDGVDPDVFYHSVATSLDHMNKADNVFGAPQVKVTMSMGAALSAGFVTWVLRGGAILSALMSSMPAWRGFDPMIILADDHKEDEDTDPAELDQAEKVFDRAAKHQTKPEGTQ